MSTAAAELEPLIPPERIAARLRELAREIEAAVPGSERPLAVVVMQGAFVFAADLLRHFSADYPLEAAFLRCRSYYGGTSSTGQVELALDIDPEIDLTGRTLLLIDDILDTGLTLRFLVDHLRGRGASRIRPCVLLRRRERATSQGVTPDWVGFDIGNEFVVGYGLDYGGRYRHLPGLSALKQKQE